MAEPQHLVRAYLALNAARQEDIEAVLKMDNDEVHANHYPKLLYRLVRVNDAYGKLLRGTSQIASLTDRMEY